MELSFYKEAQKVWNSITQGVVFKEQPLDIAFHQKLLDIFHVGNYYFLFFDIVCLEFRFISAGTQTVLGYPAEKMTFPFFMSLIHPDDQNVFLNHEAEAVNFLKQLPNEKLPKYKISYDFRLKKNTGEYVRILHQGVAMNYDEENNLLLTMCVHTDISHLKKSSKSVLSFIGLEGEPSYVDVEAKEIYKTASEIFTKREKEVLLYILRGEQSQSIADKLFISKHTVDTHRKNILAKTDTKNTIELAIKIVSEGLI